MKLTRPSIEMAPLAPVVITSLKDGRSIVTIKATEVCGNKSIAGRQRLSADRDRICRDDGKLVAVGEPVSVQGRFEDGFVHASRYRAWRWED